MIRLTSGRYGCPHTRGATPSCWLRKTGSARRWVDTYKGLDLSDCGMKRTEPFDDTTGLSTLNEAVTQFGRVLIKKWRLTGHQLRAWRGLPDRKQASQVQDYMIISHVAKWKSMSQNLTKCTFWG